MSSTSILSEMVAVRGRFARSANVERDSARDVVGDYVPTARALDVVRRVAAGVANPANGRAISITGPYGSGKSSLALFLRALLSPASDPARAGAGRVLAEADPDAAAALADAHLAVGTDRRGFVPAVVAAQREPIATTIV